MNLDKSLTNRSNIDSHRSSGCHTWGAWLMLKHFEERRNAALLELHLAVMMGIMPRSTKKHDDYSDIYCYSHLNTLVLMITQ